MMVDDLDDVGSLYADASVLSFLDTNLENSTSNVGGGMILGGPATLVRTRIRRCHAVGPSPIQGGLQAV